MDVEVTGRWFERVAVVVLAGLLAGLVLFCCVQVAWAKDAALTPTITPTRPPTNTPLPSATRRPTRYATTWPIGTRPIFGGIMMTMTPIPTNESNGGVVTTPTRTPLQRALPLLIIPVVALVGAGGVMALRWNPVRERVVRMVAKRDPAERERRRVLKEHQRQEKRRKRNLKQLAKFLGKQVADTLAGVGYVHEYRNPGQKKKRYEKIKFSHAVIVGEEQVLFRVYRVPYRKSRWDLFANAPGVSAATVSHGTSVVSWYAAELYLALERQVQITFYEEIGILIQVALKQGVAGVPRLVLWKDDEYKKFSMMLGDPFNEGKGRMQDHRQYPRTRYQINVGLSRNRKVIRQDLSSLPHLIVSGTTGSGKSNFLNQMICTWLERNTPETLALYLIDLKIMEFAPYLRLSQDDSDVIGPSMVVNVIQDEIEAANVLESLYKEIVRRQRKIAGVCVDLDGWNEYARLDPAEETMPRIIVVFDELSIVMLNKRKVHKRTISHIAMEFLAKCVAVGRSCGVHMVLCTQVVSKQVLDLLVQGNTPGKMIFRQATRPASINALGDSRAWTHLEQPGMGFFCNELGDEYIVQTPLILESQRDAVIEAELARIQGRALEPKELTIQDIVTYAVLNYGGKMARRDLWAKFKGRISQHKLNELLQAHDDNVIRIGLRDYWIRPGVANIARRAICVSLEHIGAFHDSVDRTNGNGPATELEPIKKPDQAISEILEISDDDGFDEEAFYKEYKRMMERM